MSNRLITHFGLSFHPFNRGAHKDALLRHTGFEEALSRLRFTVELEGIAALVAESGCGKSLLLGELAEEAASQGWAVHYLAHTTIGPFGLINVIARKIGKSPCRSRGETAMLVTQTLLVEQKGTKHLLVIDDAHELPDTSLVDLRLLTVADFDRKSPFLLLLAGQPALDERLAEPTHHALDQRMTTVARLQPLSLDETRAYLRQRLAAAGVKKTHPVFESGAEDAVYDASGGVPRRINQIATGAMIVCASKKRRLVTAQDVQDARVDRGRS